ncbi:MAG: hypothetical protein AAGG44_17720, partial [Planctomycetota bacterium]
MLKRNNDPCQAQRLDSLRIDSAIRDMGNIGSDGSAFVCSSKDYDIWTDGSTMWYREITNASRGIRSPLSDYSMYWKPSIAVAATGFLDEWFVMAAQRLVDDHLEWILFGHSPHYRHTSEPIPLSARPTQMVASSNGDVVAVLDEKRLSVLRCDFSRYILDHQLYHYCGSLVRQGRSDQLEIIYRVIGEQERRVAFLSPSQMQEKLVDWIADHWYELTRESGDSQNPEA